MDDQPNDAERLRGQVREYILDMLSQLATMAEQCCEVAIADILKKAAADVAPRPCFAG